MNHEYLVYFGPPTILGTPYHQHSEGPIPPIKEYTLNDIGIPIPQLGVSGSLSSTAQDAPQGGAPSWVAHEVQRVRASLGLKASSWVPYLEAHGT